MYKFEITYPLGVTEQVEADNMHEAISVAQYSVQFEMIKVERLYKI